jgi:hypothetical protein
MHTHPNNASRASGHVYFHKGVRGPVWRMKFRLDGKQFNRTLGPAWTAKKGRPPAGHYTKRTAQQALNAILADARTWASARGG